MKMKSKRRWLASLMAFVMLTSALPVTAFAEGHTHTEECYAKEGDLLCRISESEGHTHTSECVCPGGEYICGLEEIESHTHDESCYDYIEDEESDEEEATPSNAVQKKLVCGLEEQEGHTHTSECVCPGGENICGLEETEGHTHGEDCYAKGGELICREDDIQSDDNSIDLISLTLECTVSTAAELKQALLDGKSEIGISGLIELSEEITVEHAVSFIGMGDDDNEAGFVRADGYDGTLLNIAGTDSASIAVTFSKISLDGKSVESAKSAVSAAYTTLTIEDSVFKNCTAVTTEGAYPNKGSVVNGAAIYARDSTVNITDTTFTANTINTGTSGYGDHCGGASLYMVDCDAEISGCDFTDNKLNGCRGEYGIAVYAENGVFTFTDSKFLNNSSDQLGYGALYVCERNPDDDSNPDAGMLRLNIDNCVFSENSTQAEAGGISTPYDGAYDGHDYNDNRYIDIKNSEFTDNYGDWEAGAILLCGSRVTIDNTKFNGNEGVGQAGAALFYFSDVDISNSEFSDNSSSGGCSGAIHVWDSTVRMTEVDICNNTAKYEGGAMCIYSSDFYKNADGKWYIVGAKVTFNDGNISNNETVGPRSETEKVSYGSNGGGVFVHTGGTFILNDGTMEGNSSCMKGGAVCVDDDVFTEAEGNNFAGRFYMNGGMIRDNHADMSGGGVYVSDVVGGDYIELSDRDSAHFVMEGGTIRDNTAGENGGGVFVQYSETPCVFTMSDDAYVFDNKTNNDQSYAGDDIYDETDTASAQKTVNANYPYREYSDILAENCIVTPIAGQAIPDELKIPFVNWYIDEAADTSGNAHRFVNLASPIPDDGKLNVTNGLKAIWGGYLLLYDANDGSGRTQYHETAFYPGENATVSDNMFPTSGKEFIGWNTEANGSGTSYNKDAVLPMNANKILYAQYSNTPVHTGSLTISKKVTGTGTPAADTLFDFTVTKAGVAASGKYSVDGDEAQVIPVDSKISIKAGQSALLTGLEPGEYTVTETTPAQANYKSTTFSVNGEPAQNGCTATVTVSSTAAASGGWKKEGGNLVTDDDGYFTYTLTADQIDADGNITVDCDLLAEYVEAQMQAYQNYAPRSFKVKFVNETGAAIRYQDYEFDTVNWIPVGETYTPSGSPAMKNTDENSSSTSAGYGWGEVWQSIYSFLIGQSNTAGSLNADGFDGNKVRTAIAPLRCINPAVVSYFSTNPGLGALTGNSASNSAQTITLQQMNALPELIKQEFTFKNWEGTEISLSADDSRTYADFICAFYGVDSLDKLTVAQKYNVLGTGYKGSPAMPYAGQSHITTYYSNLAGTMSNWCIPYAALNDGSLDYFKTWGFSKTRIEAGKKLISGGQEFSTEDAATYAYQQDYYLLESDPEILSMAYEYLYDRCIRFSLDSEDRPVSTSIDNSAISDEGVGGIKDYMDKTEAATANVLKAMNNGVEVADGESITLDHVKGYIEVPNAWNQFRYYDFGFKLTFKADEKQPSAAAVAFINDYKESDTPTPPTPSEETGNLIVSKIVAGNAGDTNKAFSFTVKLGNSDISGSYGEMTFANGIATFTLKHNEKKTATGLPAGISYEVTESEANQSGYTTTSTGANGSIVKDQTVTAAFTNTKKNSGGGGHGGGDSDDSGYGNLTVSKTVSGTAGDTAKAFTFTIKLDHSISGKYGDMTFDKGTATITLKHGESSTAKGLPSGIHYSVTESDNEGYTVNAVGDNGIIKDGKTVVAAFTNNKDTTPVTPDNPDNPVNPDTPNTPDNPAVPTDPVPQTGDESNVSFWLALMIISFVAFTGVCIYGRKRRDTGHHVQK